MPIRLCSMINRFHFPGHMKNHTHTRPFIMVRIVKMLFWLSGIVFLLLASDPVYAVQKHALLIGIGDYSGVRNLSSLDGTLNDLELTKNLLMKKQYGFKEENIIVLRDHDATHSNIAQAMIRLADTVKKEKGGIVYIHYSGHGSQTRNLNEQEQEDYDQTWVSYGARTELVAGIDQWDILDDEIREWLSNISDHANQVILVSDSCHSGSITRGEAALKTRAAMRDDRTHPLGMNNFRADPPGKGVFIGASKDVEQAGEYLRDDTFYGLFTWFWIQNLEMTKPGETWHDILRKTRIQVQGERNQQSPQIRGALANATVFDGTIQRSIPRFPVSEVTSDNKTVTIEHGIITGATPGSIYKLYNPGSTRKEHPMLQLTSCTPFNCSGQILSGTFTKGRDLVVEDQHAYLIEPISLRIDGDSDLPNQGLIEELRTSFAQDPVPGFRLIKNEEPHTISLYATRPVSSNDSAGAEKSRDNARSGQDARTEIWILDSTNHLWADNLRFPLKKQQDIWSNLRNILQKIAKAKEIKRLASRETPQLEIEVTVWRKDPTCIDGNGCLKDRQGTFRKEKTFPFTAIGEQGLQEGDSLTFTIINNEGRDLYIYLLNIGPDDSIIVLFPRRRINSDEDARIARDSKRPIDTKNVGRLVLSAGNETIKIIATHQPIAINYFNQESYTETGEMKDAATETRGAFNPFNTLIAAAIGGKTRGQMVLSAPAYSDWGTIQVSIDVTSLEK